MQCTSFHVIIWEVSFIFRVRLLFLQMCSGSFITVTTIFHSLQFLLHRSQFNYPVRLESYFPQAFPPKYFYIDMKHFYDNMRVPDIIIIRWEQNPAKIALISPKYSEWQPPRIQSSSHIGHRYHQPSRHRHFLLHYFFYVDIKSILTAEKMIALPANGCGLGQSIPSPTF